MGLLSGIVGSKVTLRFDTEGQDPPLKWPFPFVATAVYELCSNEDGTAGIVVHISIPHSECVDGPLSSLPCPSCAWMVFGALLKKPAHAGHLDCTLHLENKHTEDAPFGGGWHPYFPRHVGTGEDALDPVLTIENIQGVYPDAQGTRIPSGPLEPLVHKLSLSVPSLSASVTVK